MSQISGSTRVLAVFGDPVAHSLSPLMQNQALAEAGINAVYVACHVAADNIGAAVSGVRSLNIWGVNLTVPHKEMVCPFLDELTEEARLVGAVNTIVNQDGRLTGHNTDVYGFLNALDLDLQFNPAGKRVLILGAGGACRAAVVAFGQVGAKWVGVANRTIKRAESLANEFSQVFDDTDFSPFYLDAGELTKALEGIDLLVNTSSVGLKGDSFAVFPWADVPSAIPVMDIVYCQEDTPFVTTARGYGHKASGGLGMLAAQGEKAFQLWTGIQPAAGLMRKCLMERKR